MAKTRWGILSTAKIGTGKVIPGIQRAKGAEAVAIASRDLARAEAVAKELGIPKAYGSYEALLADPDIDAIYNTLPNHLHVPLTLQAVAAGKHVLCEKPIGLTAQDAAQLLVLPRDRLVMEAFMVRFHPQWLRAREAVRSGELGEVRAVQAFFSYYNVDPANVRNQLDIGGGGILDVGCYPIVAGRFIFEAEPRRVIALVDRDPAAAKGHLEETSGNVKEVVADVRRLVHDLRPPALDDRGLVGALAQLAERQPYDAEVDASGIDGLPAAVEVAAYRIAAEALTNVARHAEARTAVVRLVAVSRAGVESRSAQIRIPG